MPNTVNSYAAPAADKPLVPLQIKRRDPGPKDVQIELLFCGICHSDIHTARNEWKYTAYPCVPGHEMIGRVTAVGAEVKKFKKGDTVGVGCMVDSCRNCSACKEDLEQHCEAGPVFTYNSEDKLFGGMTYGGYSQGIVVDQDFVLQIPEKLDPAAAAPLLCAGITTYSPLRRWNVGKGQKVGVVGLGGLGHMAVKFAAAFGAKVYVFSRSKGKEQDAKRLGATGVIISTNEDDMKKHAMSFDFILDTVSADHDLNAYLALVKRSGNYVLVGAPEHPLKLANSSLVMQRRHLAGSLIGGIKETQEMLDFCGKQGIVCDIEKIPAEKINAAYDRVVNSDVKYRFVIDLATLK